jgi:hypothetical protein
MFDRFFHLLVRGRKLPFIGKLSYLALKLIGVEIPAGVTIGNGVRFPTGLVDW